MPKATASQAFEVVFGGEPPRVVVPELKLNWVTSTSYLAGMGDAQAHCLLRICPQVLRWLLVLQAHMTKQAQEGFNILRVTP